jgi:hypothetical protein
LRAGPGLGEIITDIVTAPALSISIFGGIAAFVFLSSFGAGLQIWTVFEGWATSHHCGGKEAGPIGVRAPRRLIADRHFAHPSPTAAVGRDAAERRNPNK